MQNYYTPMILNVFIMYVKISWMLLLLDVLMVQWHKIHALLHDFNELLPPVSTS